MFGLGKKRTKFGKWIDQKKISQEEIAAAAGVGRNTIGRITNDFEYQPGSGTVAKIIRGLEKLGHKASAKDLF